MREVTELQNSNKPRGTGIILFFYCCFIRHNYHVLYSEIYIYIH